MNILPNCRSPLRAPPGNLGVVQLDNAIRQNAADPKEYKRAMGGIGQTTFESGKWAREHGYNGQTPEQRAFEADVQGHTSTFSLVQKMEAEALRARKAAAEDYIPKCGGWDKMTKQYGQVIRKLMNGEDIQRQLLSTGVTSFFLSSARTDLVVHP